MTQAVAVQIFGTKKSSDTRKAQRFFAERRIRVHFVDLMERAAAPGELQRFVQKFGVRALIDQNSKRFRELGLGAALLSDERWFQTVVEEPLVLRMPLVRHGNHLTVGLAESEWRAWIGR